MRTGSRPSSWATAMVLVMMSATSTAAAMTASSRTRFAVAGAASGAASGWSLTLSIMPVRLPTPPDHLARRPRMSTARIRSSAARPHVRGGDDEQLVAFAQPGLQASG